MQCPSHEKVSNDTEEDKIKGLERRKTMLTELQKTNDEIWI